MRENPPRHNFMNKKRGRLVTQCNSPLSCLLVMKYELLLENVDLAAMRVKRKVPEKFPCSSCHNFTHYWQCLSCILRLPLKDAWLHFHCCWGSLYFYCVETDVSWRTSMCVSCSEAGLSVFSIYSSHSKVFKCDDTQQLRPYCNIKAAPKTNHKKCIYNCISEHWGKRIIIHLVPAAWTLNKRQKTPDKQTLTCFPAHLFWVESCLLPWCIALCLRSVRVLRCLKRFSQPSWTPAHPSPDRHMSLFHLHPHSWLNASAAAETKALSGGDKWRLSFQSAQSLLLIRRNRGPIGKWKFPSLLAGSECV